MFQDPHSSVIDVFQDPDGVTEEFQDPDGITEEFQDPDRCYRSVSGS